MYRAVLLVTLIHLAVFASCGIIISNDVDDLLGSVDEDDLEFSRDNEIEDRPVIGLSHCKVISKNYLVNATRKVSWHGADLFCRQKNMELVAINNAEEYQMLLDVIIALEGVRSMKDAGVWTSGYYDSREGKYRWMSGDNPMDYTIWRPGRPGSWFDRKKCVELRKYDQYKMNDVQCDTQNYIACQKHEQSWRVC